MGITKNDFVSQNHDTAEINTLLIHSDDVVNNRIVNDVAPPINVTTTFRYSSNPEDWIPWADQTPEEKEKLLNHDFVYSRLSHPNNVRLETNLNNIFDGYTTIYNSGLSAFNGIINYINPKQVFLPDCYHGIKSICKIWERNYGTKVYNDIDEIFNHLQEGDLVHIENPINPFGTVIDIKKYIDYAHEKKAYVVWDATFAPSPIIKNHWDFDPDFILHSLTKYYAGHSDLLAGCVVTKSSEIDTFLKNDRIYLGTNIGNLESFLLLRSLRSYELRVEKQSSNAKKIVEWLADNKDKFNGNIVKVSHAITQRKELANKNQDVSFIDNLFNEDYTTPVFSLYLKDFNSCKTFIANLKYFQHATSLGGVESLVELRCLTDPNIDRNLIRISIGCESPKDLIKDIEQALKKI
ncbi:hypothetical protein FOG48_03993 [Hanseniaspora uvarum]|nr:hypothetical protein FOG48_03993 [Hanseniaspora uvarum]